MTEVPKDWEKHKPGEIYEPANTKQTSVERANELRKPKIVETDPSDTGGI